MIDTYTHSTPHTYIRQWQRNWGNVPLHKINIHSFFPFLCSVSAQQDLCTQHCCIPCFCMPIETEWNTHIRRHKRVHAHTHPHTESIGIPNCDTVSNRERNPKLYAYRKRITGSRYTNSDAVSGTERKNRSYAHAHRINWFTKFEY